MNKNFSEFKEYIRDKSVAVVGIGVSNTPLIRMLVKFGAQVTACDKRTELGEFEQELNQLGVKLVLGENYLDGIFESEIVFRTPSLLPNNEHLLKAKEKGVIVTSEMGEFIKYCPCKIFGVTGSDGKTTTTTLIGEMFKESGATVYVGGNIGTPLFTELDNITEKDVVVIELSSFQLMDIGDSPEIAVITNLSPNHLDYHKDMKEYTDAKKNIYLHQDKNGMLVLNKDNDITRAMEQEAVGNVRFFSVLSTDAFACLVDDQLVVNGTVICHRDEIKIPGLHNIENLLTAFSAVEGYITPAIMRKIATTFNGVEHRIEFVRELDGVKFYNGSIASSPTRTLADIHAFGQKVVLIAGGYDKNIPFDELARYGIDRIKLLVLMGNTKKKIREAFESELTARGACLEILEADSMEEAVQKAFHGSKPGDVVTLSPACASFDMYKNFDVRGKAYKEIVNLL